MTPLAKFPTTPDDPLLTKRLMDACFDGEKYTCPKCNYHIPDPWVFKEHLQEHLNEFMEKGPLPLSRTPPPPGYDLTKEPPVRPTPQEGGAPPEATKGIMGPKP